MTQSSPLRRVVTAHVDAAITETAELVFSVAVAYGPEIAEESLTITLDGAPIEAEEVLTDVGGRLHLLPAVPPGKLILEYKATVVGASPPPEVTPLQRILYQRPSRYADSDVLAPIAAAEFGELSGENLLDQVEQWVFDQLLYVSGSSRPIDGAVETMLARQGVCRDFAHLVAAILRARGVPARVVSVYAPGLQPMDFHAVAEACVDGAWYVVDATRLAPRQSLLRISTGRDAADNAFLTMNSGKMQMGGVWVTAVVEPELPVDDHSALVQLT